MKWYAVQFVAWGFLASLMCSTSWAQTQAGANEPVLQGKVAEVATKGKTTTLKVLDEVGNFHDITLSPKVDLEIMAAGDDGFLAAGLVVEIQAVESNDSMFGTGFTVYPHFSGKKPAAKATKVPPATSTRYKISGEILKLEDVPDGKYDLLHLKGTGKTPVTVYVEASHTVEVAMGDASQIESGQPITIYGTISGSRVNANRVTIQSGKTLKGEEFLPTLEKKAGKKK